MKPHIEGNLHSTDKSWLSVIPLQPVPNRSPKLKDSGLLIVAVSESVEKHSPSLCGFFFSFKHGLSNPLSSLSISISSALDPFPIHLTMLSLDRVLTAHLFIKDAGLKHFF